jgi:type I restriction enzyme M protein
MDQATHSKIVSFLWGIADDVLRDLFKRGKYPDVILPMCVLRRLDAVLEPAKKAVLEAKALVAKVYKPGKVVADPLHGRYEQTVGNKRTVVDHETDSELRDTEQVPLLEPGGIEAFFRREVLPHVPDAWIDPDATRIGYEISFTRSFYQPKPLRTLEEIRADILAVQQEAEGLLDDSSRELPSER